MLYFNCYLPCTVISRPRATSEKSHLEQLSRFVSGQQSWVVNGTISHLKPDYLDTTYFSRGCLVVAMLFRAIRPFASLSTNHNPFHLKTLRRSSSAYFENDEGGCVLYNNNGTHTQTETAYSLDIAQLAPWTARTLAVRELIKN
jgi:hypothetical protein